MNWCVTSETGTKAMNEDMGFTIPFKTAAESTNVFVKQDQEYTEAGLTPVSWNFTTMPSESGRTVLVQLLLLMQLVVPGMMLYLHSLTDGQQRKL